MRHAYLLLVALALTLAACGRADPAATPSASPTAQPAVTIADADPELTPGNVVPDDRSHLLPAALGRTDPAPGPAT